MSTEPALPKVTIGMPVGIGTLPWATAMSLMTTVRSCDKAGMVVRVESVVGCSVVQWARSIVLDKFLKSDSDLLFWIDSDIVWTVSDFFRLVGFVEALDVVGATYALKRDAGGFLVNLAGEPGQIEVNGIGCVRVKSLGLGFTVMKREVVEKVAATKEKIVDQLNGVEYADVFRVDRVKNRPRGEDVAFFDDIRELGYSIWLDPSIRLGHVGQKVYSGDVIDALGLSDYVKQEKK